SVELEPEVREIIQQVHENYDGSGFPKGLKESELSSLSQIVAVADRFDECMSGRWDGKNRSPKEAFAQLEKLQARDGAVHLFSPEIFAEIQNFLSESSPRDDTP